MKIKKIEIVSKELMQIEKKNYKKLPLIIYTNSLWNTTGFFLENLLSFYKLK